MRCARTLSALSITLLAGLMLAGCAAQTEEEDRAAAQAEAWATLQQAKADLDAKRQELRALRESAESDAAEGEAAEGEAAPTEGQEAAEGEAGEPPPKPVEALQKEVNKMAEEFTGQLAAFINSQEIYEGEPLTEVQRAAFDMKADEDILVAKEYIEKAGNYQKAIDIYTTALLADPTSEKLMAAKAEAEALRHMTEERFAPVKKGMTRDEVKALLGTPKPTNVREFEKGVIGWFYPKEEPRTAAGVYFRKRKGEYVVYSADFEAIKADEEEEEG